MFFVLFCFVFLSVGLTVCWVVVFDWFDLFDLLFVNLTVCLVVRSVLFVCLIRCYFGRFVCLLICLYCLLF
jgi:hypothetical protein